MNNVSLNDSDITMAQPYIDTGQLIFGVAKMSPHERISAISGWSLEEKQAVFGEIDPAHVADHKNLSPDDVQKLLAKSLTDDDYGEHANYLISAETSVDRMLQRSATQVPLTAMMTIEDCHERSKKLTTAIFSFSATIYAATEKMGGLIQQRWHKMSKAQRRELLLTAWPGMSTRHRPDMDPDITKLTFQAQVWPYINLKDLVKPEALPMFLNSRGQNLPDIFAYSDLELAPVYKLRKEFLANRLEDWTMTFLGRTSPQTYGELTQWDDANTARESIKTGRTVHVYHGVQILEIQAAIWEFLSRCVELIMASYLGGRHLLDLKVQADPSSAPTHEVSLGPHSIASRDSPYRVPTRLDFTRLQALVDAQMDQSIEHAIALREDPGYFVESTESYLSHRPELVLDARGERHPEAKDYPMYNKAQSRLAVNAHLHVLVWHEIHERIAKLRILSAKYAEDIDIEKDLPSDYFDALVETRFFIEYSSLDLISRARTGACTSPPLRKYFVRDAFGFGQSSKDDGMVFKQVPENVDESDEVLRQVLYLLNLLGNKGWREFLGLHAVLDELEGFIQSEPRAKQLITPYIASLLSELSTMSEALHQLHHFQPWAQKIETTIQEQRIQFTTRHIKRFYEWGEIDRSNDRDQFCTRTLFKIGNPKDGKFYYPVEKRRNCETTNAMIAAEAALDTFWKKANAHWLRYVGTTPTSLVKHIIGDRAIQRTAAWTDSLTTPLSVSAQLSAPAFAQPLPEHSHDESKQITGHFKKLAVSTKHKKKTRGPGTTDEGATIVPDTATDVLPRGCILAVDKRAYKVFRNLFHSPESPDQPGEVSWPNFLHALTKAGFGAEKIQGSAWHFTPQNIEAGRSIQFHEPHPSNKLPFTWARRYGRRLSRAFGWTQDSFTLA
jgi:hypothetical protein